MTELFCKGIHPAYTTRHQSQSLIHVTSEHYNTNDELGIKGMEGILKSMATREAFLSSPDKSLIFTTRQNTAHGWIRSKSGLYLDEKSNPAWYFLLERGVEEQVAAIYRLLQWQDGKTLQVVLPGESSDPMKNVSVNYASLYQYLCYDDNFNIGIIDLDINRPMKILCPWFSSRLITTIFAGFSKAFDCIILNSGQIHDFWQTSPSE